MTEPHIPTTDEVRERWMFGRKTIEEGPDEAEFEAWLKEEHWRVAQKLMDALGYEYAAYSPGKDRISLADPKTSPPELFDGEVLQRRTRTGPWHNVPKDESGNHIFTVT